MSVSRKIGRPASATQSEIRYTEDDVTDIDPALDHFKKTDEWKRGTTF